MASNVAELVKCLSTIFKEDKRKLESQQSVELLSEAYLSGIYLMSKRSLARQFQQPSTAQTTTNLPNTRKAGVRSVSKKDPKEKTTLRKDIKLDKKIESNEKTTSSKTIVNKEKGSVVVGNVRKEVSTKPVPKVEEKLKHNPIKNWQELYSNLGDMSIESKSTPVFSDAYLENMAFPYYDAIMKGKFVHPIETLKGKIKKVIGPNKSKVVLMDIDKNDALLRSLRSKVSEIIQMKAKSDPDWKEVEHMDVDMVYD